MFFKVLFRDGDEAGNVLFALIVKAGNKIRAGDIAAKIFKNSLPEVYQENRHSYFIEATVI